MPRQNLTPKFVTNPPKPTDLSLAKRDKLCNDHGYDVYDSHE